MFCFCAFVVLVKSDHIMAVNGLQKIVAKTFNLKKDERVTIEFTQPYGWFIVSNYAKCVANVAIGCISNCDNSDWYHTLNPHGIITTGVLDNRNMGEVIACEDSEFTILASTFGLTDCTYTIANATVSLSSASNWGVYGLSNDCFVDPSFTGFQVTSELLNVPNTGMEIHYSDGTFNTFAYGDTPSVDNSKTVVGVILLNHGSEEAILPVSIEGNGLNGQHGIWSLLLLVEQRNPALLTLPRGSYLKSGRCLNKDCTTETNYIAMFYTFCLIGCIIILIVVIVSECRRRRRRRVENEEDEISSSSSSARRRSTGLTHSHRIYNTGTEHIITPQPVPVTGEVYANPYQDVQQSPPGIDPDPYVGDEYIQNLYASQNGSNDAAAISPYANPYDRC